MQLHVDRTVAVTRDPAGPVNHICDPSRHEARQVSRPVGPADCVVRINQQVELIVLGLGE